MRSLSLIIAVAVAYALLRGWEGAPALLLRSCLAVATLVAGLAFWGIRRDASLPRMLSLRRTTWLDYLTLGTAIIFVEALFVVMTSLLVTPAQNAVSLFQEHVADPNKLSGTGNNNADSGSRVSGILDIGENFERQLSTNSNPKISNQPEVFLELNNTENAIALLNSRIHLRSFAFSNFDGVSWSSTPANRSQLAAPITFPSRGKKTSISYRIYHAVNPRGHNLFTTLQGVTTTDLSELTRVDESIYLLPDLAEAEDGYSYNATSKSIHLTDLIGVPIAPAEAKPRELYLPPELADRLRKTANSLIYEPDLSSRLIGLRSHLQDNYTYSLDTYAISEVNPLENFLYQEKRGYCEHFATAAAMLCRALGVPSRIAYGWSGGRFYKAQNIFVFRAKDAHAWTEIKLKGYGWVVFDTTPPDDSATPEAHAAPEGEEAPDPRETIAQQQAFNALSGTSFTIGVDSRALYIALAIAGVCCAAFFITRSYKRPISTADGRTIHSPPPSYLLHFKQTCASIGHPMPTGRTLRQHIAELIKNNVAPEFAARMLEYHYGIIYSNNRKDRFIEKQLHQAIRQWKKSTAPSITRDNKSPVTPAQGQP